MAMARPMGRPASPPIALICTVVLLAIAIAVAVGLYLQQSKTAEQIAALDKKVKAADAELAKTKIAYTNTAGLLTSTVGQEGVDQAAERLRNYVNDELERIPNRVMTVEEAAAFAANVERNAELRGVERTRPGGLTADEQKIRDMYKNDSYRGSDIIASLKKAAEERQKFYEEKLASEKRVETARAAIDQANKERDATLAQLKDIGDGHAKKVAEIEAADKTKLDAKDAEIAKLTAEKAAIKKQLDDLRIAFVGKEADWDAQRQKYDMKIADLMRQLRDLSKAGTVAESARPLPAKLPDGAIAQVFPDMNLAYLRLTRPQQAKLGMRYVVFGKDKPIPDNGEGKAVLEISSLEGGSIQAKIIKSTAGDPMVPGDPVLNLVVGPRKYNFVVFGQFDLNNDGVPEPNGRSQTEALITRWGGRPQSDIDISTNFVILGEQPQVPPKPPDNADAVTTENYERKLAENRKWADLWDRASRQTIPIMNTATFLHFIGYFNDDTAPGWERRVRPGEDYFGS